MIFDLDEHVQKYGSVNFEQNASTRNGQSKY